MKPSIIQLTQLKRLRAEEKASGFIYPGRIVAVAIYEETGQLLQKMQQPKEKGSIRTAIHQEHSKIKTKISLPQKSKKEKGVKV